MESVKKSIDKRALHKREYDSWVNERHMQTTEEKDTSIRSGNDAHADDVDIRSIYDEEPMAEFAKSSILGKLVLQPHRNKSIVRQSIAFKSERPRISKPRFASQVDVNNDSPKPVTTHYFPRQKESAFVKPHHMIAPSSSRTVGLRWVPTGKIFTPSTTKVDSEPPNGSNADITNQYESAQTLDVSAGLAPPRQMTSDHNSSELGIHDHSNELSSSKLVPKVVPPADKTATSRQELELLFHHHITMLRLPKTTQGVGKLGFGFNKD
ncbi:hypothetical protein Tco_0773754 [Tanacetum coccineum]|uniref:Uncharacterized protein n=1 Tax=Tanacetum coccineum TaxID=301880 RepID=A0ABQ4ZQT6_9ASTR